MINVVQEDPGMGFSLLILVQSRTIRICKGLRGTPPPLSFFSAAIITLVSVTPALDLRQTQEPQIKYKLFYKVTGFSTHHCRENVQAYSLVSYLFLCCIKYL